MNGFCRQILKNLDRRKNGKILQCALGRQTSWASVGQSWCRQALVVVQNLIGEKQMAHAVPGNKMTCHAFSCSDSDDTLKVVAQKWASENDGWPRPTVVLAISRLRPLLRILVVHLSIFFSFPLGSLFFVGFPRIQNISLNVQPFIPYCDRFWGAKLNKIWARFLGQNSANFELDFGLTLIQILG